MKRTYYYIDGVTDNKPKPLSREKFHELCSSDDVKKLVSDYQNGDAEAKKKLPAAMWLGTPSKGKRLQNECVPTQLYLIDIDHISATNPNLTPSLVWESIKKSMGALGYDFLPRIVHETPSKDGLRMVLHATEDFDTLEGHAQWFREKLQLDQYGKFDCLKNLDRISFLVPEEYILFESPQLWDEEEEHSPIKQTKDVKQKIQNGNRLARANGIGKTNNTDAKETEKVDFFGFDIQQVIDERFKKGTPSARSQSRHDQSLRLARDLMVMLDRNKALTWQVLTAQPWVKEIMEERNENVEQTIESALGYIEQNEAKYGAYYALTRPMAKAIIAITGKSIQELKKDPNEDEEPAEDEAADTAVDVQNVLKTMPTAPPVIRELISICPPDFVIPAINALMPILGTLTSYVRTEDKQNSKTLSTSFFSIIYAPPSSGKSFVDKYISYLLRGLKLRDEVNSARDAVFARSQQRKSANERGDVIPMTTKRIMSAKNSEAEFLEKQRNNAGHHMFTYCPEIDQWKKGVRAAGGNKDDMIRIAWDNGEYGQDFKSTNTFKGTVNLYWNVLIAGTEDQLRTYFRNVTNGLVTRCCFQEIKNQLYQKRPPSWKQLTKRDRKVIDEFIERCDRMTYSEKFDYDPKQCYQVADADFDQEVPWQFTFRPFTYVDIDWILPTINKFYERQCDLAIRDQDEARDTFRRRVGERGKRLALLCTQFYNHPMTKQEQKLCAKWIGWWLERDIEGIMEPFAGSYIKAMIEGKNERPRCYSKPFDLLSDEFTANDVTVRAKQCGIISPASLILHRWSNAGFIENIGKNKWKKKSLNIKN